MQTYELTYIVSDAIADDAVGHTSAEVAKEIERLGGVIIKEEPWGKRRLAYPINKRNFGTYVTVQTHLEGSKVAELDRYLRLQEDVIRHLTLIATHESIKPTDEAELAAALSKRVEEKVTKKTAAKAQEPQAVVAEVTEQAAEEAPKRKSRTKTNEQEKKAESEAERKKLVEEKLNEILGE